MDSALFVGSIVLIGIGLILYIIESANVIKVSDLQIPTDRFVSLVLKWCETNIGKSTKPYKVKVFQSIDKKMAGQYQCEKSEIYIYFIDELPLKELVDSCVHEYTHHLQFTDIATESQYFKWSMGLGYWLNPFEIEARRMAKKHRDSCLTWLLNNEFQV